ncbi:MAG: cytochrome P450 [Actinobacteria bacterium]|nr:cytochrome P450 [Actinomycetota bacterium]
MTNINHGNIDAKAFNLFDLPEDYYLDPQPYFKSLRDDDPIHINADGSVLLTRHADIISVWRDLSGVVNRDAAYKKKFGQGPLLEHHTTSMLFRDPPDHDRLRSIVNPFFTQKSIERLRQATVDIVDKLIIEIEKKRDIDFIQDFSSKIPVQLVCDIFGVPREEGPIIRDLGAQVLLPLNPTVSREVIDAGHIATQKFKDYLIQYINKWRALPTEETPSNIISALVAAEKRGEDISENEMAHLCILILNGGHETTTNLIGLSAFALMENPDQMTYMASDTANIPVAVEECIRYCSPLQLQGRRTTREVTVSTGSIAKNTEVIFSVGSGNRDERVFDQPNSFNLERKPNLHLAFGAGIHVCLGRPLARMELAIALPALAKRFPKMKLTEHPTFNKNVRFRGIKKMNVNLY